jgi:hypothetical protein
MLKIHEKNPKCNSCEKEQTIYCPRFPKEIPILLGCWELKKQIENEIRKCTNFIYKKGHNIKCNKDKEEKNIEECVKCLGLVIPQKKKNPQIKLYPDTILYTDRESICHKCRNKEIITRKKQVNGKYEIYCSLNSQIKGEVCNKSVMECDWYNK